MVLSRFFAAHGIVGVSKGLADDLARVAGIGRERITVIYSGVPRAFFEVTSAEIDAIRARYGLKRPFIFALGTIEPRKNIPTLLAAFDSLPPSLREHFELVLAGPMGWADGDTTARIRNTTTARYLGYIPEPDLAPLTAAAAIFAYPSLYEGFGLPILEAMACGTPVVTANVTAMPEIAGDAALLVDPTSVEQIASAMEQIVSDSALRQQLRRKGLARSAEFSWARTAARVYELIKGG